MTDDPRRRHGGPVDVADTGMVNARIPALGIVRDAATSAVSRTRTGSSLIIRGMTRHGIVASALVTAQPVARRTAHRAVVLATGAVLIGLGVALFSHAGLGLPPYDVLLSVVRDRLGISLGQAAWMMAALLLTVAALLRQLPTLATLAYVFVNGVAVDTAIGLLIDPEILVVRVVFVVVGITSLAGGIALVVHSGLGGGAFELLMRAGAERGVDPLKVRTALEVSMLSTGIVLGGDFGPATVVFALSIGPMLRLGAQALADHRAGREHRLSQAMHGTPAPSHAA